MVSNYAMNVEKLRDIMSQRFGEEMKNEIVRLKSVTLEEIGREVEGETQRQKQDYARDERNRRKFAVFELLEGDYRTPHKDPLEHMNTNELIANSERVVATKRRLDERLAMGFRACLGDVDALNEKARLAVVTRA